MGLVGESGSGKTTRLARRIKHLVEDRGADPEGITVITFTREAARNMRERLMPPAKKGMPDVTLPPQFHPRTIRASMGSIFRLPALATDINDISASPPNQSSSFGTDANCATPPPGLP